MANNISLVDTDINNNTVVDYRIDTIIIINLLRKKNIITNFSFIGATMEQCILKEDKTWEMTEDEFTQLFIEEKNIYKWNQLRKIRNNLLNISDRYSNPDFPHKTEEIKEKWKQYRQDLRDIPQTYPDVDLNPTGNLTNVTWPTLPS